jgi:hypothetical protein
MTRTAWAWLVAGVLTASGAQARELAGKSIPEEISADGKSLRLNGAAVQRKFIFNVYAVALYLERPARTAEEVISSEQTKQIHLRMLRSASREQVADALRNGVAANTKDINPLRERLERLFSELPDVKGGDEIFITYVPGKGTTLRSKRKSGLVIEGKDFADALLGIWLGDSPGIARIRRGLLGA